MNKKIIIAIDGFSSCGKSTVAKALAKRLGYAYVDTGAMYRAVTLYLLENKIEISSEANVVEALHNIHISFGVNEVNGASEIYLNDRNVEKEIRLMPVADNVSKVSAIKAVRMEMVALQQKMGKHKGLVMDGRDIGTAVFPNAELKIFMTANPDVRAKRRFDELTAKGTPSTLEAVKTNIELRDHDDTHRKESPLVKAEDAVILDNTNLNQQQQLDLVIDLVEKL
jgi:cytidylate kinase